MRHALLRDHVQKGMLFKEICIEKMLSKRV